MHSSRTRTPGPKSTFGPRRDPGVRPPIYLQGTRILPCPPHLQGGLFPGVGLRNPPVSAKPVCHLATFGSAPPCECRRPREAEREGDQQSRGAQPHFHPLLPSGAGGGVGTHAQSRPDDSLTPCFPGKRAASLSAWERSTSLPVSTAVSPPNVLRSLFCGFQGRPAALACGLPGSRPLRLL